MKVYLKRLLLGLFLVALVATVDISPNVSSNDDKQTPKPSTSDCSFMNNPGIIPDPTVHIHELSNLTSDVAARVSYSSTTTNLTRQNYVDNYIFDKMAKDGVKPAPLSSDEEFIRRVTLDLTGRIPSATDVKNFLTDKSTDKRSRYIDSLIGSPAFVDRWTMWFGDHLKNYTFSEVTQPRFPYGRDSYNKVIREAIQNNTPYNKFVTALIATTGRSFTKGEVNFLAGALPSMRAPVQDTLDNAAVNAATLFLGLETLDCLLCHDGAGHLDALNLWATKTKRAEAQRMSAFFARANIRLNLRSDLSKGMAHVYETEVTEVPAGDYRLNTTDGNRPPREPINGATYLTPAYILTGETPKSGESYLTALARMLTKDRQFARATVNYLWAHFFGLGIVDPPTNFDPARLDPKATLPEGWSVQPSHPELLEALADDFIASGYDLRHIMKVITKSTTYQLSSRYDGEWKEEYTPYFARKLARRLDAEEIHDAILIATGVPVTYTLVNSVPETKVNYAMQLPDTAEPIRTPVAASSNPLTPEAIMGRNFLDTFQRGNRSNIPRRRVPSINQSLTLMNNPFISSRLSADRDGSTLQKLLNAYTNNTEFVNELFLAVLSRKPSSSELEQALAILAKDRKSGAEDLLWVLLNKIDFIYNY
ncbi:MAG: DUF1553 domain-containing protein [Acidobacteriota bacterium]|nr:DUF1549 and DUF1553 domain-containing protein [Blastocatellia bacterium]MDW8411088.1 DUF1553 domain-containing protein [Acidobacteriota bacterium]